MTIVTRPRGPLPARVYWTRRLVLLTLVVLVGWLMLRWIDGGDSGAAQPGGEDPVAATESDETERTTPTDGRPVDRERTARIRTVAESFERPREDCDLTKVRVLPSVADPVYSGEPVQVTLRISSTSSTACSLGVDPDHLLVSITSRGDVVWDSTKCEDAIPVRELALQPRWSSLVDVTWSGLHSGRNCAPDASVAEPGPYTVKAAVLEGEPNAADVEVVERPEPPPDGENDKGDGDKGDGDGDEGDEQNADGESAHSPSTDAAAEDEANTDTDGDQDPGGKGDGGGNRR
jgi:hypothetical protein